MYPHLTPRISCPYKCQPQSFLCPTQETTVNLGLASMVLSNNSDILILQQIRGINFGGIQQQECLYLQLGLPEYLWAGPYQWYGVLFLNLNSISVMAFPVLSLIIYCGRSYPRRSGDVLAYDYVWLHFSFSVAAWKFFIVNIWKKWIWLRVFMSINGSAPASSLGSVHILLHGIVSDKFWVSNQFLLICSHF